MPKICYTPKKFGAEALGKIKTINGIIDEYANQGFDLTLRQLYYQMVSRDFIANNIREYKNLGGLVNDARLAGYIDWDRIVDRVRNLQTVPSWDDPAQIIKSAKHSFHMDHWETQDYRVEVWVEKNALIGVIEPVCVRLDVPFFACIGYTSQSEMWSAAQRIRGYIQQDKIPVILHLGDHDPSGMDMSRDIEERLNLFLSNDLAMRKRKFSGIQVDRIALNMNQIEQYGPPPNPAKLSDSRSTVYIQRFGDESWELDALSPTVIDNLIDRSVRNFIAQDRWEDIEQEQQEGTEQLGKASRNWEQVVEVMEGWEG